MLGLQTALVRKTKQKDTLSVKEKDTIAIPKNALDTVKVDSLKTKEFLDGIIKKESE